MEGEQLRPMTEAELPNWYTQELSEAFESQERKPLADMLDLLKEGRYALLGLFSGDALLGYAGFFQKEGVPLLLLDYLGVSQKLRGHGVGSRLLSLLRAYYPGRRMVLESELPREGDSAAENALRTRRIGFYLRNGFTPVYEMATCGLRWQAFLSEPASEAEIGACMIQHRALYGPARRDVKIPLLPGEEAELPYWMAESGEKRG